MIRTQFAMRHSNADALALYRAQVGIAVRDAAEKQGVLLPMDGPIILTTTFVLPRPKSAPKRRVWPLVGKDLDKLARALCDALTQCGAWADDAQVVEMVAGKRYVGQDPAMPLPGTWFSVAAVA